MLKVKTPFEQARASYAAGELNVPSVSDANGSMDYFGFQISVHKFNLSIMAMGMKCRGITFTDIKNYYGLTGRSAKACLPEFKQMVLDYQAELLIKRQSILN